MFNLVFHKKNVHLQMPLRQMITRRSQNNRNEINKRIRAQIDERRHLVFNSKGDSSDTDNIKIMYNEIAQRSRTVKNRASNEFFSIYTKNNTQKFNSVAMERVKLTRNPSSTWAGDSSNWRNPARKPTIWGSSPGASASRFRRGT